MEQCRRDFGDLFTLELGRFGEYPVESNGKWVFVSRPEHVRTLFSQGEPELSGGEANRVLFLSVGDDATLGLDGEAHALRRRLLHTALHSARVKSHTGIIREITTQIVSRWQSEEPFSLQPQMQEVAFRVILHVAFGPALDPELEQACSWLKSSIRVPTLRGQNAAGVPSADWMLLQVERLRERAHLLTGTEVLALLFSGRNERAEPFSDEEVAAELVSLLRAGLDTTSTMLCWTFERILTHSEVYERVCAELTRELGGRPVDEKNAQRLLYLEGTIKEAHRTRSIIQSHGVRLTKAPFLIGDYLLPPGTMVANCAHLTHTDPLIYPEPQRFNPERFLDRKESPFMWTPFGGGMRRCPGSVLALHEIKIALATVLSIAKLEIEHPVTRYAYVGPFVNPEGGLRVRMLPAR